MNNFVIFPFADIASQPLVHLAQLSRPTGNSHTLPEIPVKIIYQLAKDAIRVMLAMKEFLSIDVKRIRLAAGIDRDVIAKVVNRD